MKKMYLIIPALLLLSCLGTPKIKFQNVKFDYGICDQKINVDYIFKFQNIGDGTLIIDKVRAD